jgi:hypothetical protein
MKAFAVDSTKLMVSLLTGHNTLESIEQEEIQRAMKANILPSSRDAQNQYFEELGFVFGNAYDEVFQEILKSPKGWTKVITPGCREYVIRDEKRRPRIVVQFKPRKSEYSAFAKLLPFYQLKTIILENGKFESYLLSADGDKLFSTVDSDYDFTSQFVMEMANEQGIDVTNPILGW